MADARIVWLICAGGFVFLAICGIALVITQVIASREMKHLRRCVTALTVRVIDLEKGKS